MKTPIVGLLLSVFGLTTCGVSVVVFYVNALPVLAELWSVFVVIDVLLIVFFVHLMKAGVTCQSRRVKGTRSTLIG